MTERTGSVGLRPYQDRLRSLPVGIAGRSLTFLFDLGAGVTAIDASLGELAPGPRRRVSACRMTRERIGIDLAPPVPLSIGGVRLVAENPAVLDLSALLPAGWPRIDGVIALDILQHVPFRADFAAGTLTIGDLGDVRRLRPVPVRLFRQIPGVSLVVLVPIRAGERVLWFELDNSNVGPVVLSPESAAAMGLSTDARTAELTVDGVGPFPTPIRITECLYDGNLGGTFTEGRAFAFDLARARLWIGGR